VSGLRRLFWLNVAAAVFCAGVAGYHYHRNRVRRVLTLEELMAPIATAREEGEVGARAAILARAADAARKEGGHLLRAMGWLAFGAACMFLWNAVSLSEVREELSDLEMLEANLVEAVKAAEPEPDEPGVNAHGPGDKGGG
jgi:hypothetical protein